MSNLPNAGLGHLSLLFGLLFSLHTTGMINLGLWIELKEFLYTLSQPSTQDHLSIAHPHNPVSF